jgi:hypothetical protein
MYKKISFLSVLIVLTLVFSSCKKDKKLENTPNNQKYNSVADFYKENCVKTQKYTVNGVTGGNFTTPNGTTVTIPANCFVTAGNGPVTGNVTIHFKDIYSQSDMLLSDVPTNFFDGTPLKSGGEFFINALVGDSALQIAPGMKIDIEQPLNGLVQDTAMKAMVLLPDTMQAGNIAAGGWFINQVNNVQSTPSSYIFSLYQFSGTNGAGTWCNSDNPSYFQSYTNTTLTVNSINGYDMDVFLIFKNVNSMVHVYQGGGNYPYVYAPVGLECTVVAIGMKDQKLHASFSPVTITNSLSVNPSFEEMTTEDFKEKLSKLNQ